MTNLAGGSQGPPAFYQLLDPFDCETRAASVLTRRKNKNHETDKTDRNLTP
jgi:hypothetical protein